MTDWATEQRDHSERHPNPPLVPGFTSAEPPHPGSDPSITASESHDAAVTDHPQNRAGPESDAHGQPGHSPERLLSRLRAGDREAAAEFALRYGPRIRRRVAGKLGPRMRRIFDSQDILSTVLRRFDNYVQKREFDSATEEQLLALVVRIAENAVIDKARIVQRLERAESADGEIARALLDRLREPGADPDDASAVDRFLDRAFDALDNPIDRQILWFWLAGRKHSDAAEYLDIPPDRVRKRWERIRASLGESLR